MCACVRAYVRLFFRGRGGRHGTNGKTNGVPKEHAGTFLGGALVSMILPMAGIAYFVFFKAHSGSALSPDVGADTEDNITIDQVLSAIGREL